MYGNFNLILEEIALGGRVSIATPSIPKLHHRTFASKLSFKTYCNRFDYLLVHLLVHLLFRIYQSIQG